MDSSNGAPSTVPEVAGEVPEVAGEVPSEVSQSAIEVNEALTPLLEVGKSTVIGGIGGVAKEGEMESSSNGDGDEEENTLELAAELFEEGSKAIRDEDFVKAVDSLSRSLEIRVSKYGELAPECASSYYKYGCALLYKAQVETDPLGDVPKNSAKNSARGTTASKVEDGESSMQSTTLHKSPSIDDLEGDSGDKNEEDENVECEEGDEELGDAEEDDSDLDFAWKMLDIARVIIEKNPEDSLEKANVFSALGEVSMEREDVETSLSDFRRALAILENVVEPDNRRVIELNFRICLVLEMWANVQEAASYCEKAISLCKSRLEHLQEALATSKDSEDAGEKSENAGEKSLSDVDKTSPELSLEPSKLDDEIDALSGILIELEKKHEDLQQQLLSNPQSILTELLKRTNPSSDFARSLSTNSSQMAVVETDGFDSPSISTAANDGVQHLGVVGRGVKRAIVSSTSVEPPPKKLLPDFSAENSENCGGDPPSSGSSIK